MPSLRDRIQKDKIPNHIAIIMDGNGRWAKARSMTRLFGHHNGVKSVREVTESCARLGVKYLTLYTFSTEKLEQASGGSQRINEPSHSDCRQRIRYAAEEQHQIADYR